MILGGYSATDIFSKEELILLEKATRCVEHIFRPEIAKDLATDINELRCHEIARAVGDVLELQHQDGFYGFVDHTWLWTTPMPSYTPTPRLGFPNILDVYSVGSLPMVRLVACAHPSLPHVGWAYRPETVKRIDVRHWRVQQLAAIMDELLDSSD